MNTASRRADVPVGDRPRRLNPPRMSWLVRGLALFVALAVLAPPAARADDDAPATTAAPAPPAAFSGDQAYHHVRHLADTIGSRPTGTESEAEAARYLADELTRYGYQTEVQPFSITTYEERGAVVRPLTPRGMPIETSALVYSAAGDVAGDLVDAGLGREGDWAPGALAGRVALVERGEITFSAKVDNVAAAGATAAIIFNNRDASYTGNLNGASPIPAVTLAGSDGQALRERLQNGPVRVSVLVDADTATRQSRNVIGMRPGRRPEAIVVGAHFDSVPAGPGANDNASGTATMLELARVFAQRDYPYTLYFIAFGAEEIGLRGSRHFVEAVPESTRSRLRAMINVDMVGVGDQERFSGATELVDMASAVADAIGFVNYTTATGGAGGGSDHASFDRAGVPVLFIHRTNDPNYHSPRDRAEFVDPDALVLAGRVATGVLDRLAAETR
jgi:aminopeptidase YwaD